MTDSSRLLPPPPAWAGERTRRGALLIGGLGLVAWLIGVVGNPSQAYLSYLTAYTFAVGVALGALLLIVIEHLVNATWFVVMRRFAEHVAALLPALTLLFIPIIVGLHWVYPWTNLEAMAPHARRLVEEKTAYLNVPFFLARAAVYFASWSAIALLLRRWSLRQDVEPGERWQRPQRVLSAPAAIVLAFTLTFAAFDWVMSLSPTWVSTIFGVQIFAGGMVGALAVLAVLIGHAALHGPLLDTVHPDHLAALGKMLLTFVIFWAYASFAQLLIIWIGNIPEEVIWYRPRLAGSWLWTGAAVAIGQFAVPFFTLLSYHLKRRPRVLIALGVWTLVVHYVEVYWIVMPQLHPESARPHWQDAAALFMVLGLAAAWVSWCARGHSSIPLGDPEIRSAVAYSDL